MTGQEIDLLEFGGIDDPRRGHGRVSAARCLKGENGPEGEKIVAGRVYRALAPLIRQKKSDEFWTANGRGSAWSRRVQGGLVGRAK